ncbi:DUF6807 family protein [Planctomicrobium piriforme]|uniref:Methane oxygenase PmoA n=1 Tax=Planctomicrobium piriforme TaxID=1576369 RepID=A0A1I3IA44_9PLAN|nr:DUF6807 family protein [Planctomicrobium piriforme]SFI44875.1 Methane oxygenase PmoA [Planctomicrobium piriforme]
MLLLSGTALAGSALEFIVHAGDVARRDAPIRLALPEVLQGDSPLQLTDSATNAAVPVQRLDSTTAIFVLNEPLAAHAVRRYRLETIAAELPASPAVTCEEVDGRIRAKVRGRDVFDYHTAVVEPPAGADPKFRRSGHLHPVQTPTGRIVTDAFPADHMHQHAIFAAWVNTEFEGRHVDFWNQHLGTGTVEHRRTLHVASGPVCGSFQVELAHVDLSAPSGPKDALHETWQVTVYAVTAGHLFEITSEQRCASSSPLLLKEYHYGGMAARGAAGWTKTSSFDFLTSDGKHRADGNHTRPNWVNMHGPVEGGIGGLTVFSSPANERSPQPIRLHPNMPYCVYTPVVLGDRAITPEQPYRARYLYFVQDGPPDPAELERIWQNESDPPRVEWP